MLSIGDFAYHGRVSVRMLRHYDAIGLLVPDRVDPNTGYRSYQAAQLSRLNRIVALRELGFGLPEIHELLDEKLSPEQLRGMLRLRQSQLQAQIAGDSARLGQVEARLRVIEGEGVMLTDEVIVKALPAVRLAELSGVAAGFEPESITPVIRPLYDQLMMRLDRAGVTPVGPAIAHYEDAAEGGVLVHAGLPVNLPLDSSLPAEHGFDLLDLPPVQRAAAIVHRGSMDGVLSTIQALGRWIDENGYRSAGYNRELYLDVPPDEAGWVTELQEPLAD